jgi:O-antigen/teichoic acid export membrane protein
VDVLAMSAYAYYRGALNGWRAFRQLSFTIAAYSLTKLVAIVALVLLGLGLQGALLGNVVSSLGGLAVGYSWTRRRRARTVPDAGSGQIVMSDRTIMAFVLPAALFTLASNLLLGLDLMGVKALVADADQVGYYSAALKLAEAPRLVLLAFSFTLLPSLSHAIAAHDPAQTRHYLEQTIRLLAVVLLPILALVTASAPALITLTFSATYRAGAPILSVLIFTYAAYTVYITLVTALLAENKPRQALAIPVLLLPLAVAAIWWGVSRFGPLGAAYASLLSVAIAAIVVMTYVLVRFKPRTGVLGRSLLRCALASAAIWGLARLWLPAGLLLLLAYGLLGLLYLVLLLLLGEVRTADLVLLASWLPRRKRGKGV